MSEISGPIRSEVAMVHPSSGKRPALLVSMKPRLVLGLLLLVLSYVALVALPSAASARSSPTGNVASGSVKAAFEGASRRWGIPLPVLMAVANVESHWDQRGGAPSLDNGYGIMHL